MARDLDYSRTASLPEMTEAERTTESERLRKGYEAFRTGKTYKGRSVSEIRKACGCED